MKLGISAGATAAALVASALSCRGQQGMGPNGATGPAAPSASATAAATSVAVAPAPAKGRVPTLKELAPPQSLTLEAEVRPVGSRKSALVVHTDALGGYGYVRRIDDQHVLGPIRVLPDRYPVTALDGDHAWLVSSRGRELCLERLDESRAPVCHAIAAEVALVLDGKPVLLEQREEEEEEEGEDAASQGRRKSSRAKTEPKLLEMRLWVHRLDADGDVDGDPVDSGLVIELPLPGMGLVAAAPHANGIRVLHYEHDKPKRDGRRWVKQAKLTSVLLGKDGKLVAGSARTVYQGDRAYGHVEGHQDPRLFGSRVLVGRYVDPTANPVKTGWEGHRLGPVRSVPAPNAVFGVDPWRLENPRVVGATELAALTAIYDAAPRLTLAQPPSEAGRVAWVGDRGFFLKDGKLTSAARSDGTLRKEPEPFVAKQSRLHWATLSPDGSGLAQTSAGLVAVRSDGSIETSAGAFHDVLSAPVQIGGAWWSVVPRGGAGSGAAVTRLTSSPIEATTLSALAHADSHVLVGGATDGLFAAINGGRLSVFRLAPDGTTGALATSSWPHAHGIAGVARAGGGMIVVGRTLRSGTPIAAAIDENGKLTTVHELPMPTRGRLEVVARGAGAIVLDAGRSHVVWLDATAAPVASAPWPASGDPVACADGVPARDAAPSPEPGKMARIGKLAGGHCWSVSVPVLLPDGSHRWVGSAVDGIDSRAVLATLPSAGSVPAGQTAAPKQPAVTANKLAAPSPCPPDMVSIGGSFCIDRFESQLVDAKTGHALSPDYPATASLLSAIFKVYASGRWNMGDLRAQAMPLPPLLRAPQSQPTPAARSRFDVQPSGYMTWHVAQAACASAGKRLCTKTEWVSACRGEADRKFPYGSDYAHGKCNVWRYQHPAAALHGNPSIGHLDPRLNRVREGNEPLLRHTGATTTCASRWGDDAVFDMVGNLDEWIEDDKGVFAGGFYSRTTKKGCGAMIYAHPKRYLDYSLGTRCCKGPSAK